MHKTNLDIYLSIKHHLIWSIVKIKRILMCKWSCGFKQCSTEQNSRSWVMVTEDEHMGRYVTDRVEWTEWHSPIRRKRSLQTRSATWWQCDSPLYLVKTLSSAARVLTRLALRFSTRPCSVSTFFIFTSNFSSRSFATLSATSNFSPNTASISTLELTFKQSPYSCHHCQQNEGRHVYQCQTCLFHIIVQLR